MPIALDWAQQNSVNNGRTIIGYEGPAKNYSDLPQVECYAGQLNQVFMNLLSNAIDACDESNQGDSERNSDRKITITTELSPDLKQVLIYIKDNGVGMSQALQKQIFNDFFTTKCVGKGTGLGLAIVYQIVVKKHRGNIAVNSLLGSGSEFVLTLPVQQSY